MDLEATDASTHQNPEQMDEDFTTTAYPNVQENLKLPSKDQKKRKRRDLLRTPFGSPPPQPPPPPPPAGVAGALGTSGALGSFQLHPPPPPPSTAGVSGNQELSPTDTLIQDDSIPAEQKKRKRRDLLRTPFGSPPPQPPPPPPPAGVAGALGQAGPNPSIQDEGQVGPNPSVQNKGHVRSNPGNAAESHPQSSHVGYVRPNLEHMDLEATDALTHQNPEQMDEDFTTTAYPNVQENLKLPSKDQVILKEPASSIGTLSSLQNLEKELSFTNQFFAEKELEEDLGKTNAEAEKSLEHDYYLDQLLLDLDEALQKKRKRRDLLRTPFGSPPLQPPPPPPPAGVAGAPCTSGALGSSQLHPPPPPPSTAGVSKNQELSPTNSLIQDDSIPAEQAYEVIKAFYLDVIQLQFPMEECHKLLTDQVDWTNSEGDQVRVDVNRPLPLSGPLDMIPRRVKKKSDHTCGFSVSSELKPTKDTDFKNLHPSDFEDLNLLLLQGHLDHLPGSDKRMLSTAIKLWTRNLVIRQRVEDFQLGIESYQTQLNLTKPGWDATGYEFKHDYTIIESPRAVVFPSQGIQDQEAQSGYEYAFLDSKGCDKEQRVHSGY
nr:hypothetical protein [Tanacetum cinerariifolium]